MVKVQIYVPTTGNDGIEFGDAHHESFEKLVVSLLGGITLLPGTTKGRWMDGAIEYLDRCLVYEVAVSGIVKESPAILRIIEFAKKHYGQLAIFVTYLGIAEIL